MVRLLGCWGGGSANNCVEDPRAQGRVGTYPRSYTEGRAMKRGLCAWIALSAPTPSIFTIQASLQGLVDMSRLTPGEQ